MIVLWDPQKNDWLKRERRVSFEQVCEELYAGRVLAVLPNPQRKGQLIYVIEINHYVCVVPFVRDGENIFLKTIYQNRDFNTLYGGRDGKTE